MMDMDVYYFFAKIHSQASTVYRGVHKGPAFAGWHREFLKQFEIAVRMIDPEILGIPYWDSSLDELLNFPSNSTLWTADLLGNGLGEVTSGPFAGWRTDKDEALTRSTGTHGHLFTEERIQTVAGFTRIEDILAYSQANEGCPFHPHPHCLERIHDEVHDWVGGKMGVVKTAANDPVFYMHHAMVDYTWEKNRERQYPDDRERAYPDMESSNAVGCAHIEHSADVAMRPRKWNMTNRDALSNVYLEEMYSYALRPTCSRTEGCGSSHLFCDREHREPRCVAKVVPFGNCTRFAAAPDVCYEGYCDGERCQLLAM